MGQSLIQQFHNNSVRTRITQFDMTLATKSPVYASTIHNLPVYRIQSFETYPQQEHVIFTRKGGISQKPFCSLNLSISVGDDPQNVAKNVQIACQAVNISPEQTVSCQLVHKADIVTIQRANWQQVMGQADGLITREAGIYLFMRFGDCTPLIFFDPLNNAVGLSHAGWRGTMKNIAGATVEAMVNQFECQARDIIAVIGPAIGPCCYEVGSEVIMAAEQTFTERHSLFSNHHGSTHFDLGEANRQQLATAGVRQIIQSNLCTACRSDEFFSHRAEKGHTGRFGVIIGLKEGCF